MQRRTRLGGRWVGSGWLLAGLIGATSFGEPAPHAPAGAAKTAKADASVPLQRCIVSGEHLNAGETVTYVYHVEGKPDRTLRLCCRKCLARFKREPDRYLAKLDAMTAEAKTEAAETCGAPAAHP